MSTCRSCGAEIIWARTETGRPMPLDAAPVIPKGLFTLVARLGSVHQDPLAVSVSREHPPPLMFQSHFATCPNANEHRR